MVIREIMHTVLEYVKNVEKERWLNKMLKIVKRLFCKHDYKIEEYFFGDMKNYGVGVGVCKKCGKRKVVK